MFLADNSPHRTVIVDEKEFLFFSGTAYLGISNNKNFQELIIEGIRKYGSNYSNSRSSNFQLKIFEEAEIQLAAWVGADACMTVSSGYMAGQLVIRSLEGWGRFFYAPSAHPAMWRNANDFTKGEFKAWSKNLPEKIAECEDENIIILCNSIDALFSIEYNFNWINDLPDNKNIVLVVDDSHGIGLIGKEGRGVFEMIPEKSNLTKVVCCSIGKAMGLPGGAVFSTEKFLNTILKGPWFGTSSPMNPAYLYAYVHGQSIFKNSLDRLKQNSRLLEVVAKEMDNLQFIPDYPVFYSTDVDLYHKLLKKNILISSFPYPLPGDDAVNRIVLNSHHTAEDIDYLGAQLLS